MIKDMATLHVTEAELARKTPRVVPAAQCEPELRVRMQRTETTVHPESSPTEVRVGAARALLRADRSHRTECRE